MNCMRSGSVHTSAIRHNLLCRYGTNLRLSLLAHAVRCCSLSNNYAGGHDKAREQE